MGKNRYYPRPVKIEVVGLGGFGCHAVNRMVRENVRGVEFIVMDTDAQALEIAEAPVRIPLGERCIRGLGAGGDSHVGAKAAEESKDGIKQALAGADMVFITAGMGGGTGTGSVPIVANIAKASGALTIAVVTKPATFEGTHRTQVAEEGIINLMPEVDALIIVPNQRLPELCDNKTGVDGAFKAADVILCNAVKLIAESITVPAMMNLDIRDVRTIMKDAGPAWMSIGRGSGSNRAEMATKEALNSPLLEVPIAGAKRVFFNITGGETLSYSEVQSAASVIRQAVEPDANIVFQVKLDRNMGNDVKLTLIATGFATKESLAGSSLDKKVTETF